jgi:hypothetical protein
MEVKRTEAPAWVHIHSGEVTRTKPSGRTAHFWEETTILDTVATKGTARGTGISSSKGGSSDEWENPYDKLYN